MIAINCPSLLKSGIEKFNLSNNVKSPNFSVTFSRSITLGVFSTSYSPSYFLVGTIALSLHCSLTISTSLVVISGATWSFNTEAISEGEHATVSPRPLSVISFTVFPATSSFNMFENKLPISITFYMETTS